MKYILKHIYILKYMNHKQDSILKFDVKKDRLQWA